MSTQEENLKAIADAIREKDGTALPIRASDFPERIRAISTIPDGLRTITVQASDPEGGRVSGGGLASDGMVVTVTAEAADGYKFAGWKEDGAAVSEDAEHIFTVTRDRVLVGGFEMKSSRLPEGYTEVEYIESSGTQCIDTGVIPQNGTGSTDTKVIADMQPISSEPGSSYYFGCSYNSGTATPYYGAFYMWRQVSSNGSAGANYATVRYSQGNINISAIGLNRGTERMILTLDGPNNRAYVDDAYVAVGSYVNGVSSIALFALHLTTASANTYVNYMKARLFSCQIEKAGTLLRDFVPCIDPDGAVGLYDLVEGKFYGNAGTGMFAAGPAV